MVKQAGNPGGEPLKLLFPVSQHRGRHNQQGRPNIVCLLSLPDKQGDDLHGLSKSHVVGKTRAHAKPLQVMKPGKAPLLVFPQFAPEPGRSIHKFKTLVPKPGHHLLQAAVQCDFKLIPFPVSGCNPHQVRKGHGQGIIPLGLPEIEHAAHLLAVDLHPLTPEVHKVRLGLHQGLPLIPADRFSPYGKLIAVIHQG